MIKLKMNKDCARKILLETEKIPYGEVITVQELHDKIGEFSMDDVLNIVTIFNMERYIMLLDRRNYDEFDVLRDNKVKCLTERGFKSLDLIRDEETWNLMKKTVPNFDELSLYTVFDIAFKIMNSKHNILLGLPENFLLQGRF